jgi:hypothetical protein
MVAQGQVHENEVEGFGPKELQRAGSVVHHRRAVATVLEESKHLYASQGVGLCHEDPSAHHCRRRVHPIETFRPCCPDWRSAARAATALLPMVAATGGGRPEP